MLFRSGHTHAGHEAPYIIISAVRTTSPGFLRSLNRVNVMLTRCQAGMVLVTQRSFLRGAGRGTLLNKLALQWERRVGEKVAWADAMEVADGRAGLPGTSASAGASVKETKQVKPLTVKSVPVTQVNSVSREKPRPKMEAALQNQARGYLKMRQARSVAAATESMNRLDLAG